MGALMGAGPDGGDLTHEAILQLQAILNSNKFSIEVGDDWSDDHETCCDFKASADGLAPLSFSLWWIDARVMGWAEADDSPKMRVKFQAYMNEAIKSALKDLD